MTQARDKLAREGIHLEQQAIRAHEQVGKEVRQAIRRIGGELPEDIAPAEHIKAVAKRVKKTVPQTGLTRPTARVRGKSRKAIPDK